MYNLTVIRKVLLFVAITWVTLPMYAIPHNTRISETTMLSPVVDVTGQVTDQQGEPLIGVNVLIKGSNQGTSTDVEGNFSINNVEETAVLVFSYIGYQTLEVNLDGRSSIVVKMASDAQLLDELVVVGYGTVKKSDLTGSVASIDVEDFQNQPMTQLTDMLTGTVAGFNATQSTSAAGGASMEIRGPNSLNAGTSPMIVLDGVVYNGNISDKLTWLL